MNFPVHPMKRVCRQLILRPEVKTSTVQVASKTASGVMTTLEEASGVMNSVVALEEALPVRVSMAALRETLVAKVLKVALQVLSKTKVISDLMKTSVEKMIFN